MLVIGYSTFFLLVIRANTNTPLNENAPKDAVSMRAYLGREQYGSTPFLTGQFYTYNGLPELAVSSIDAVMQTEGNTVDWPTIAPTDLQNYINVPVMLKYYVTPEFSIDFGPQVGFNVFNKVSHKNLSKSIDIKDSTKPVDFGLGLGGTFNLTENAFVQARYTMGLTKVFKDEDVIGENNAKNGNVQIAFGMKF
jgi:hypothetical protein